MWTHTAPQCTCVHSWFMALWLVLMFQTWNIYRGTHTHIKFVFVRLSLRGDLTNVLWLVTVFHNRETLRPTNHLHEWQHQTGILGMLKAMWLYSHRSRGLQEHLDGFPLDCKQEWSVNTFSIDPTWPSNVESLWRHCSIFLLSYTHRFEAL